MMPDSVVAVLRRLADVLERENRALRTMDLPGAASLLPEKTAAIAGLAARSEPAPKPLQPVVAAEAQRLNDLAMENRGLLERAIAAQQRVIGIVVRAAASADAPCYRARPRASRQYGPMTLSTRV
jgi:hypothetical protein